MFNSKKHSAFTLVELIVVIVILAILATIAFLSFSNQSSSARDSTRLSDVSNIVKGLMVFSTVGGTYPVPDKSVNIMSGATQIGYQGEAGANVLPMIKFSADGGKDPLDKVYYTYNTNFTKNKAQLLAFLENNTNVTFNPFGSTQDVFATDYSNRYPYEKGDQLGIILIQSGVTNPTYTPIQDSIDTGSGFDTKTAGSGTVTVIDNSITDLPKVTDTVFVGYTTSTGITTQSGITGLAVTCTSWTYSTGACQADNTQTLTVLTSSPVGCTGGTPLTTQSCTYIPPVLAYSSATTYTTGQTFTYNGATITVTGTGRGTSDSKYLGCNTFDTAIWTNGDAAPQVWSLCNVGATTVSSSYQPSANDNPLVEPESKRGKYFQGGEDIAWDYDGGVTGADACVWNRDTQSCGANAGGSWPTTVSDSTSDGANRWYDWGGTTTPETRGPCATGYHVPTQPEWGTAYATLGSTRNTLMSTLKLPMTGYRNYTDGLPGGQGNSGYYWSSSPATANIYVLVLDASSVGFGGGGKTQGFVVRCLKN